MEYTGKNVKWDYKYGNYSTSIHGFSMHVVYESNEYKVVFEGRTLKLRFTNVNEAQAAAIRLAVKTLSTALALLE
jgi:hypothetical protein